MAILTFLGTGTSMGVPMIGCDCEVCTSTDERDRRSRSSILISSGDKNVLIDTTTDLYWQALWNNVRNVDAVLFTHSHADHIHGIDELRRFNHIQHTEIPCYGNSETIEHIRSKFEYIFKRKAGQLDIPQLTVEVIDDTINLIGIDFTPIEIYHGEKLIYAYKFLNCAYLTDTSSIPDCSLEKLTNLDILIIDALRYTPHKNHFSYDEALSEIERLKPKVAYLTHLTHDYKFDDMQSKLPANVKLPYDGLKLEI